MGFDKETAAKAGTKSSRKGSPNKEVKALRERIDNLLNDQWPTILEDIKKLSSKERIDTMVKLLEYSLPKLNRTEIRDVTKIEELLSMTPEERANRILEIKRELNDNQNGFGKRT